MLNLDTHILLRALAGELNAKEEKLLAGDEWCISDIVLWEIAKLTELGQLELDLDDATLTRTLARIHTWPVTLDIARAVPLLDFRGDAADEIICATSLVHRIPLVTRDPKIRKSKVVPFAGS